MSNATAHDPPTPTARARVRTATLWALQLVTAAAFLLAAVAKLAGVAQVVATFDAIGFGEWFRYLIAVLEIAGAAALLIPRLAGTAALAFVGLMVGALVTHLAVIGSGAGMVVPLLLLSAVIAWARRRSTQELWDALAG